MTLSIETLYEACAYDDPSLLSRAVFLDYGFDNCCDDKCFNQLFAFYQDVIFNHILRVNKTREKVFETLHQACINGKLFEVLTSFYIKYKDQNSIHYKFIEQNVKLLSNPYPLK